MKLESFTIPNTSNSFSVIEEARKQFGLEPANIDFDPNTYQWEPDTCAIRSQELVLRSFGKFISQEDLIQEATEHGWYEAGGGTAMNDVGKLLELHGVPNHQLVNANVFNLVDELGAGHKVIVGVDVNELYDNPFWEAIKEHLVGQTPNHAMIVSGINTSNPDGVSVTLTDPGTGQTLFECPYERFLSAWNDSSCFMVATNEPAPLEYNADEMAYFDYEAGHVASVGSIPYEVFHDNVVPSVNDYLDCVDEYIATIETFIASDFNYEAYERMMQQGDLAHATAIDVQFPGLLTQLGNNSLSSENTSSNCAHHENDCVIDNHDDDDDDDNDDM